MSSQSPYDVVILGAGPAGLSAALALGRARRRVLLCDGPERRNERATHVHNFLTRDGTPPLELRAQGRRDLATYPSVEVRDVPARSLAGERDAFELEVGDARVHARRVLLATGLVDELLPIEGFSEHWGHSIVQCPFCHGWEARERLWAYLATSPERAMQFAPLLRAWTDTVTLYTNGAFELPEASRNHLAARGVVLETTPITRIVGRGGQLEAIALADGRQQACQLLFAHPPQRQVPLVASLCLAQDAAGMLVVDPMTLETSRRGIHAAGDDASRMQAAIAAAAAGMHAGAILVHDLMG